MNRQNLPKITKNQRQILNGPIIIRELCQAIEKDKTGKAFGLKGLSVSYYKCFENELLQTLQQTVNIILQNGKIPDHWKETNIILIAKEIQDITLTRNYH